ncbi:uncharacterized protein LOC132303153 [Cornus florida]|uniref:uncharacterized protein LOC132303153 n=1 Tax=Cornus florida TaxID=4283 RepID=UPI00289F8F77|nr:uncharacterized protein LOC132303153 [Cornus florida]
MMRYHQRVSPDGLPLSNGKRSNSNSSEGKGLPRFRSPSKTPDQNLSHFDGGSVGGGGVGGGGGVPSSPAQSDNNHQHQYEAIPARTNSPSCNGGGGGDVLLQWGHRKRSRCSRADVRVAAVVAATDESSSSIQLQPRQPIKVQRRLMQSNPTPGVVAVADKLPTTTTITIDRPATPPPPPPLPSSVNSTASLSNGKKSSGIFANRRSLEERCGVANGSPSSNNVGSSSRRVVSRSTVGKRSPTLSEKFDRKAPPTGSSRDHKLNGVAFEQATTAAAVADDMNRIDSAPLQSEQQVVCNDHNRNNTGNGTVTGGEKANGEGVEWPRIYIPLTRKEKEEDFLAMKGTKLPHRPKKRAKTIERILQYCFPGMWLSDVTRGRYEVREKKCAKKQKRRGLKGMESMESDSE